MSEPGTTPPDAASQYRAARHGAAFASATHGLVWVEGPEAVTFLDGQLSQDVARIPVGGVARSFLLEPRGKLQALLWVLRGEEKVGLVTDRDHVGATSTALERYRFRVKATIAVADGPVHQLWGEGAAQCLARAGLPAPEGWVETAEALVAHAPVADLDRFFVLGGLPESVIGAGAVPLDDEVLTTLRIEAGEPLMGVDVDHKTIPQETGLTEEAVSFTKGCYLGQELVARIDSRGHVNRVLRGVVTRGDRVPVGALLEREEKPVGALTSVGRSPVLEAWVGLALVRREVPPGSTVRLVWEGGSAEAEVRALPLEVT